MVLDKGDGILPVLPILDRKPRCPCELPPVVGIDGITHRIAEGEVEGRTLLAGGVDPRLHRIGIAVPVLADRILHVGSRIIVADVRTGKALHHVITEAGITEIVEQVILVCLHDFLHVRLLVVEVAHTVPSFSFVIVRTKLHPCTAGLSGSFAIVVVGADIR